jgi:hypothetical protein
MASWTHELLFDIGERVSLQDGRGDKKGQQVGRQDAMAPGLLFILLADAAFARVISCSYSTVLVRTPEFWLIFPEERRNVVLTMHRATVL